MNVFKRATLPIAVSLIVGVGLSNGAMAALTSSASFQRTGINNALPNCDTAQGGVSVVNCQVRNDIAQVNCPAGEVPQSLTLTLGASTMRTSVAIDNTSDNDPECVTFRDIDHTDLTLKIPDPSSIGNGASDSDNPANWLAVLNGAGQSGGTGADAQQCVVGSFVPGPFEFIVGPLQSLPDTQVLLSTKNQQVVNVPLGSTLANTLIGNGTFTAYFTNSGQSEITGGVTQDTTIATLAQSSLSVSLQCRRPQLFCDFKTLSATSLPTPSGTVGAQFRIRAVNNDPMNLTIVDTMDPKMSYALGTGISNPVLAPPLGNPSQVGNVYTWSGIPLGPNESITINYQANISGLVDGDQVCNSVYARDTITGLEGRSPLCTACLTYEAKEVPAIGALGTGALALGLSGLGLLFGFRRRG